MDSTKKDRHCAVCLRSIPAEMVKLCGKCRRRAYCSRDCQLADWSRKNGPVVGQGHKNWCALGVGEEDLDWKIAPVEGKGLGVIAIKPILSKSRIMVDCCYASSEGHPGIGDLMPADGTLSDKFKLNCLGCAPEDGVTSVLCLRIARVNHSCNANAGHVYLGDNFNVKVLFAERDINEGEEICISYTSFRNIVNHTHIDTVRFVLEEKWGILCPENCICQNAELRKKVEESRKLDSQIFKLGGMGNSKGALKAVSQLLINENSIGSSWMEKYRTLYDGFQMAITKRSTLKQAEEYIGQVVEIREAITHPQDSELNGYKEFTNDMRGHRNYLLLDR